MMPAKDPEELRRQVDAGEWLRAGDVAILLGRSRTTIHRLLAAGEIGWKLLPGGKQRHCDPADVLRLLREAGDVRRGEMS